LSESLNRKYALIYIAGLLIVAACAYWLGWARNSSSIVNHYVAGDLSRVIAELSGDVENADSLLLVGQCYGQLGQVSKFLEKVDQARKLETATDKVDLAMALYQIQMGKTNGDADQLLRVLKDAGARQSDAYASVVQGMFATNQLDQAERLLDEWCNTERNSPQPEYLGAVYLNIRGQQSEAESKFLETMVRFPHHELSWLALVDIYSRPPNARFDQVESVLARFVEAFPENAEAPLRLSRIRRRLGNATTETVIASENIDDVTYEMAKVAFDSGAFADSIREFTAVSFGSSTNLNRATDFAFGLSLQGKVDAASELTKRIGYAATALAMAGENRQATEVFDLAHDRTARLRRLQDLNHRKSLEPANQAIADEVNAMMSPAYAPNYPTLEQVDAKEESNAPQGLQLYIDLCANCHGRNGDGHGIASCDLHPRPRSFIDEPIRMVSTENRFASDEDLKRTIRKGQVGGSMPGFEKLSEGELEQLVATVRWFMRLGLEEQFASKVKTNDPVSDSEREDWIAARLKPGARLAIPTETKDEATIAHGRKLVTSAGCLGCHAIADDSNTLAGVRLFDSLGRSVTAPNLKSGPFHGGDSFEEIYRRVALGIPGTPHPALATDDSKAILAIAAYIRSIRQNTAEHGTNYTRRLAQALIKE
jgi:mono/diheme cytochrome c family protein